MGRGEAPGRGGFGIELGEHLGHGCAHLLLDDRPGLVEGERRHPVLQLAELLDEIGWHQIGPGGEHLPQLDEGGAQVLEGHADLDGDRNVPHEAAATVEASREREQPPEAYRLEDLVEAVPGEDQSDFPEPSDGAVRLGEREDVHPFFLPSPGRPKSICLRSTSTRSTRTRNRSPMRNVFRVRSPMRAWVSSEKW